MKRKEGLADLHLHSCHSDGSENVASIICEAIKHDVTALALTDHNNGVGIKEFRKACKEAKILAFEGVEIYLRFPEEGWAGETGTCGECPDATILGRKLDWGIFHDNYQARLKDYWASDWVPATLEKLNSVGLEVPVISKDEIKEQLKNFGTPRVLHDVPKNPKNWQALLGVVHRKTPEVTIRDIEKNPIFFANNHLYGVGMPAYVLRVFPEWSVSQAVDLARDMGGVILAAHPGGRVPWSREHLDYFIECGGSGLEVWQYWHTAEQINLFLQYAIKDGLLVSGGSDWHGKNSHATLGLWDKPSNQVPGWVPEYLLERLP